MTTTMHDTDATTSAMILDPAVLGQRILDWKQQGFHVLSPAIQVTSFAPGCGVNASLVLLDPNVDEARGSGTDVYYDKNTMSTDERAPSKIGLNKIASAAGVNWVEPYGRVDPLTIMHLWIYRVTGVYMAYDGTPQVIKGEKEIDYRDGSAQIGGWTPEVWATRGPNVSSINGWSEQRVRQARCNGAERAETGAIERAIRTLGIKHVFTLDELSRPFVALRVCPVIDMRDAEVRRMVVAGQLGGVAKLYAGATARAALPAAYEPEPLNITPRREPEPENPEHVEARREAEVVRQSPVRAAAVAPPAPRTTTTAPTPTTNTPTPPAQAVAAQASPAIPADAVTIAKVARTKKPYGPNHRKAGQQMTVWTVTFSDGQVGTTTYGVFGEVIDAAEKSKGPVQVTLQHNRFDEEEIISIKAAKPTLPPVDPARFKL